MRTGGRAGRPDRELSSSVPTPPAVRYTLLSDHTLWLTVDAHILRLARPWVPVTARPDERADRTGPSIAVTTERDARPPRLPSRPPTLHIGAVRAWIDDDEGTTLLVGGTGVFGLLEQAAHRARIVVPTTAGDQAAADVQPMLTISSALLLGRIGQMLLHAGAVVTDGGRGWLVVGDARSGKSTTTVSLAASGWRLLSDDQVVLRRFRGSDLRVEGWLRPIHLDDGWTRRSPTGNRTTVGPSALGLHLTQGPVRIAGTLHTVVVANRPTKASALAAASAFTGLVRQSPWLLADRTVAPSSVELLSALALLPRYAISLGRDTFGDPRALRDRVLPVLAVQGTA